MAESTCAVEWCDQALSSDRLHCKEHRDYLRRYGRLPSYRILKDDHSRLMARVDIQDDGCWLWTGARSRTGYGRVRFRGTFWQAHRAIYVMLRDEIPEGLELDHLCKVTSCVNPDHVEPVTHRENLNRSTGPSAHPAGRACVARGHEWRAENIRVRPNGKRTCRECARLAQSERRQRIRV